MNLRRFLTTAALICLPTTASAQVNYEVQIIAMQGEVIGGYEVDSLTAARVNNNGEVAFTGSDLDPVAPRNNKSVIWTTTTPLAAEGELLGGAPLPDFPQSDFHFNDNGEVAVAGIYGDPNKAGFYTSGGVFGLTGSQIDGATIADNHQTSFDFANDGTVTFMANIETGIPGDTKPAIFTQTTRILTEGDTIGGAVADDIALNGTPGRLFRDAAGETYFTNGPFNDGVHTIYATNGLVVAEDPINDGIGIDYVNSGSYAMSVNAHGDLAYAGKLDDVDGIHTDAGQTLLSHGQVLDGSTLEFFSVCHLNDNGTLATVSDIDGFANTAVITQDGIVTRTGDTVEGFTITYIYSKIDLNNHDQIAIVADMTDGQTNFTAILLASPVIPCEGDTDGDGDVDLNDLAELLSEFGRTGNNLNSDLDNDGDVDLSDLATILGNFGRSC